MNKGTERSNCNQNQLRKGKHSEKLRHKVRLAVISDNFGQNYVFSIFAELCGIVADFCGIVADVLRLPFLPNYAEKCTDSAQICTELINWQARSESSHLQL